MVEGFSRCRGLRWRFFYYPNIARLYMTAKIGRYAPSFAKYANFASDFYNNMKKTFYPRVLPRGKAIVLCEICFFVYSIRFKRS